MRIRPIPAFPALLACALFAATPPAAAQPAADTTLAGRMGAFLRALSGPPDSAVAAFFPRRGDWTWVQSWRGKPRPPHTGIRRFSGAETLPAITSGGPACPSLDGSAGDVGPASGSLASHGWHASAPWHRVGARRFVPAGASARSPVFVEWRREDGAWVVAAFGDEAEYFPPLRGVPVGAISRDTGWVAEGAGYAPGAPWYDDNEPVVMDGLRYVKYGPPRRFTATEAGWLERVGVLGPVSVYAEKQTEAGRSEVLYVAVSPGEFQTYTGFGNLNCG